MTMTDPHDTGMRFTTEERPAPSSGGTFYETVMDLPHVSVRAKRLTGYENDLLWHGVHWHARDGAHAQRLVTDSGRAFYTVSPYGNDNATLFVDEETALAIHHAVAAAIADAEAAA